MPQVQPRTSEGCRLEEKAAKEMKRIATSIADHDLTTTDVAALVLLAFWSAGVNLVLNSSLHIFVTVKRVAKPSPSQLAELRRTGP